MRGERKERDNNEKESCELEDARGMKRTFLFLFDNVFHLRTDFNYGLCEFIDNSFLFGIFWY
jgi:hypothetical protein